MMKTKHTDTMENNTKTKPFIFKPTKELIEFADFFSTNWKSLSVGTYKSKKDKYTIKLDDKLFNSHTKVQSNTDSRVNSYTGLIEISKSKMIELDATNHYVFYSIIWCVIQHKTKSIAESDMTAIKYYMERAYPLRDIMVGLPRLFVGAASQENINRLRRISEYVKEFEKKLK